MRPLALLSVAFLLLTGCKRETSEAVAEAKGAAADARRATDDAAAKARVAAAAADARVHEMGQSVQQSVNDASAQAKAGVQNAGAQAKAGVESAGQQLQQGVNAAGQSIREVGQGDVVLGRLATSSATQIVVAPSHGSAVPLAADDQTRWVSKGGIGAREGVPTGSTVRVTYIVRDSRKVATQVEQVP